MDPFSAGLLSLWAAQNPEQAGPTLSKLGVPVPSLQEQPSQGGIGSDARFPVAGGQTPQTGPEILPWSGQPAQAQGSPVTPEPRGPGLFQGANPALQGIKAPAPLSPVMTGGVAGGVKEPQAQMSQGNAVQALLAALLNRGGAGAGEVAPSLGSYIRGGRY